MITQQIKLNQVEKQITAIALSECPKLGTFKASEIDAIRITGELVQVRVVWRDRVYVFPFDKSTFRDRITAVKQALAPTEIAA